MRVYSIDGEAYEHDGDGIWRCSNGEYVGYFDGDELWAPSGVYLGEFTSSGRLGTKFSKKGQHRGFSRGVRGTRGATGAARAGRSGVPGGFEDFAADLPI